MPYNFDTIASTYDGLNHLMTFGIDVLWRRRAVRKVVDAEQPLRYLDVATGTGDLARDLLRSAHRQSQLIGTDISDPMMQIARKKIATDKHIINADSRASFAVVDAEQMPFSDASFDRVTVAFGVRNFAHLQQGLNEMARVLRPGGKLMILELSFPDNPILLAFYKLYANHFLPWLCGTIAHNKTAYRYLPQSIMRFPKPNTFVPMLQQAGLSDIEVTSMTFGVCRMYVAKR